MSNTLLGRFCEAFPHICAIMPRIGKELIDLNVPSDPQIAKKLQALEDELKANNDHAEPASVVDVAESLRRAGIVDLSLILSQATPRLVTSTTAPNVTLLGRAMIIQARSLEALDRPDEATAAFALAEHLYTLAGQTTK